MNYRHAFHAGNHADVLKHIVMSRIIAYLKTTEAAFRVFDAHAGDGIAVFGSRGAAAHGLYAGEEFGKGKGLAKIIIGAGPQS